MSRIIGIKTKAPVDVRDIDISYDVWMPDGDELDTATAEVDDDGLSIDSVAVYENVVKVWISGGEDEHTYTITVAGTTVNGRTKSACFQVRVSDCE